MPEYKDLKTGARVEVTGEKFIFPSSGAKILVKTRPPISKETSTD
jgi:hypothetical protein